MSNVSAKVIAHSKSSVTGKEIITYEWEFPRPILAEVNTHNAISKNASSSRAIPVKTILDQLRNDPAMPVRFGKANTGMQDAGVHDALVVFNQTDEEGNQVVLGPEDAWRFSAKLVADIAQAWHDAGYAKQICNRWTETAQRVKQVVTATELENFFWLRDHHMADPTIEALAKAAKVALEESEPVILQPGEWHVPYYTDGYWKPEFEKVTSLDDFTPSGVFVDGYGNTLEDALAISASCCAQVSYRKLDETIEKARGVVSRLNLQGEEPDEPVHASPLEHQGTPIEESLCKEMEGFYSEQVENPVNDPWYPETWQEGITHMDRDGTFCSGNLKGWIQHRQLVPNHVKRG